MKLRKKKLKTFCFDIDGVICSTKGNNYKKSKPKINSIKKINKLYLEGHTIWIFTSRFMGRSKENISKAKKSGYQFTFRQLKKWKLEFHKLIFGKPSFDVIIDDKALFFQENWKNKI